ncbi:uncharacterized protein LOC125758673 [Rhipicephalus sanguineus]|uniref:uncharacterized protein LOC125758673 n=1 Tax=Rhipicephalus sanguineus TaxID=34632 RepID=UPI0020C34D3C|nr:uncharacterized protein LOC125758673 [Rhipicephalus sanguineus]
MRSLPEDLAIQYRKRTKTGADAADSAVQSRDEQVKAILKFLQVEVESREESLASREKATSGRPSPHLTTADTSPPPLLPSALALTARSSSPGATSRPAQTICPLCGISGHLTRNCRAALSAEEKHQRLSSNSCCFRCGKKGHIARSCRTAAWLMCDRCSGRHISAVCDIWGRRGSDSPQPTGAETREAATQREKHVTTAPASSTRSSSVLLQTATVWASGTRGCVPVRLLLDTGSQRTFIRKDLSQQLCLPSTGYEEMDVYTFGGSKHPRHYQCRRVNVTLCARIEPIVVDVEALEMPEVCTVKGPALEPNVINMMRDRNLTLADEVQGHQPQDSTISVLIGSDHYWRVVIGRVECLTDNLCAVETIFGWVIQGMCANVYHPSTPRNISATALFLACSDDWRTEVRPGDVSEMWRLDAIGITDGQEDDVSQHPALVHFRSAIHKSAGRYVVPLMIKTPGLTSCTNRSVAETRLKRKLQRFEHHPEVLKEYHATIGEYFKEGHAERVVPSAPLGQTVDYLPHHAVVRREAVTTKVRVVFDASSHEYGEPSLNDMLDKDIKLGPELLQLLLQFRSSKFVLTADIRKAFLQIWIRSEDRDAIRFLWIDQLPTREHPVPTIIEWRMTRVPFGASPSPFLLSATLQHHLETWKSKHPDIVARLQRSFYVDDLVIGAFSEEEALEIYREANAIVTDAGMELRKWCSNSRLLCDQFLNDGLSLENVTEQSSKSKVLGLLWDRPSDDIIITTQGVITFVSTQPSTKRTVLQAYARLFDPLGFVAPFHVTARILLSWVFHVALIARGFHVASHEHRKIRDALQYICSLTPALMRMESQCSYANH